MSHLQRVTATAPGRVTLIGEHTDYNAGRAIGVATVQRTAVTAVPGPAGVVEVASTTCGTAACEQTSPSGPDFVVVAAFLATAAGLDGVRMTVTSDLPLGAGLSSSAAYAVAVALALGLDDDRGAVVVAKDCQAAEAAAGSNVGLLDQLVVLSATEGAAVDLDFSDLSIGTIELGEGLGFTIVDSGERRLVATSAYGSRRAECEAAAAMIGPLGLATHADLARLRDPVLARRARHVVTECERVEAARPVLAGGDVAAFGAILDAGHVSLRDDFDVSTPGVEALRDALRGQGGVTGVRLTGAGFGGCLLVAHEPGVSVRAGDRWRSTLRPGAGASVSWTS